MDVELYVDILTGENLSSIYVANMDIIFGQLFHPLGGELMWERRYPFFWSSGKIKKMYKT